MSRKIALKDSTVAFALGALVSPAMADAVTLTDTQMDQITAGLFLADGNGVLTDSNGVKYTPKPAIQWQIDTSQNPSTAPVAANTSYVDSNGVTWIQKDLVYHIGQNGYVWQASGSLCSQAGCTDGGYKTISLSVTWNGTKAPTS